MYLDKITNNEIQEFIKVYVKKTHQKNKEESFNIITEIVDFNRKSNLIQILTITRNSAGTLKEEWILTPYKAFFCWNYKNLERSDLLKEWSKFIYTTLKDKDEKLAEEYKQGFMENLRNERDGQIKQAKNKYNELIL